MAVTQTMSVEEFRAQNQPKGKGKSKPGKKKTKTEIPAIGQQLFSRDELSQDIIGRELPVRALSLLQPWATLIALGVKQVETRSWVTGYRGPLAIHASVGKPPHARAICEHDPEVRAALEAHGLTFDTLPRGCFVAAAELLGCARILAAGQAPATSRELDPDTLTTQEQAFGDYTAGRFAWRLGPAITTPHLPYKGALSVWAVPVPVAEQLVA